MINDPPCPVCNEQDWRVLGVRAYGRASQTRRNPYVQKRLDVMFDVWLDGVSEVSLNSLLCQHCGFVCYAPRPTEAEITAKYEFLSKDPATHNEISRTLKSDRQRSQALLILLTPYLEPKSRVLDFGGGNGRLMAAFVEAGHDCYLVDFSVNPIPGVNHLGSDLGAIGNQKTWDLVVISHVLEHLADPAKAVREVRRLVAADGLLYVEVPLEIWRHPPLAEEPVTHINYFTEDSVRILLQREGYDVLRCQTGPYTTEDGGIGLAVRAFARPDDGASLAVTYDGCAARSLRLVSPGFLTRAARGLRYPALVRRDIRRMLARRLATLPLLWRLSPGNRRA